MPESPRLRSPNGPVGEAVEAQRRQFQAGPCPEERCIRRPLDLARTVCRRAERRVCALVDAEQLQNVEIVVYLNRLSDLLWLWVAWPIVRPLLRVACCVKRPAVVMTQHATRPTPHAPRPPTSYTKNNSSPYLRADFSSNRVASDSLSAPMPSRWWARSRLRRFLDRRSGAIHAPAPPGTARLHLPSSFANQAPHVPLLPQPAQRLAKIDLLFAENFHFGGEPAKSLNRRSDARREVRTITAKLCLKTSAFG